MGKFFTASYIIFISMSLSVNAQVPRDTTITANLYSTQKMDVITLSYEVDEYEGHAYSSPPYILDINGEKFYADFEQTDYVPVLMIIDLDTDDMYKEVAVMRTIFYFQHFDIFRYDGNKIEYLGEIPTINEIIPHGDNTVTAPQWMGFWECIGKYELTDRKFEPIIEEEYYLSLYREDPFFTVTESFELYKEKDVSSTSVTLNPDEKVMIIKADIREICPDEEAFTSFYPSQCNWYYLESSDGKKGWVRLTDFSEKIEMLPWAG